MKNKLWWIGMLVLTQTLMAPAFAAAPLAYKAQFAATSKKIAAVYEADKRLCNDETSPRARLRCRRDAKVDFDKNTATAQAKLRAARHVPVSCANCCKPTPTRVTERASDCRPSGVITANAVARHKTSGEYRANNDYQTSGEHSASGGTGEDLRYHRRRFAGTQPTNRVEGVTRVSDYLDCERPARY